MPSSASWVKRMLPKIDTPTLIVHPREDDIADLDNAVYLQRRLGGLVETVVLDDSYHIITLDRQRNLVVEKSAAFARALIERIGYREPVQPVQVNAAE